MRKRRVIAFSTLLATIAVVLGFVSPHILQEFLTEVEVVGVSEQASDSAAMVALSELDERGRAPKTGYSRDKFGGGWSTILGCTTRNIILNRDLENPVIDDECRVTAGVLHDMYTGETIAFDSENASAVQIDHIVALSDAWQKGAQALTAEERRQLANDPLELLAVSGPANQQKGDADAASWLPSNKPFRCEYVARQIAVKKKYRLWVTAAEKGAMSRVLSKCPLQILPGG